MSEDLHLTGKSERTVHGYLRAIRQLADHCRKPPDQIHEADNPSQDSLAVQLDHSSGFLEQSL